MNENRLPNDGVYRDFCLRSDKIHECIVEIIVEAQFSII